MHSAHLAYSSVTLAATIPARGMRRLRSATVALALLALGAVDAHAQLRAPGGAVGIGGAGAAVPGLPRSPLPDGFGGSITPNGAGDRTQPTLPRSDGVDLGITGPSGVLNTIMNPLPDAGRAPRAVGDRINRAGGAGPSGRSQPSRVPPAGERRFVPDEVVVSLPSNISRQALDEIARRHRLSHVESRGIGLIGTTFHRWRITDPRSVSDVIRALEADGSVAAAQPNYRFALQQSPPSAASELPQYALGKLRLAQAHRFATGDGVLVAVIDSAVDASHPEIAGMIAASFDATNSMEPPHSHGTAMAGAIIARARLKGVAPAARILAIRAFDANGQASEATTLTILRSLDWAVTRGARVINMSFAGPHDPEIARGLAAARQKGVVLVAAAGNAGSKSPPLYPAADPNVIAVTATDALDKLLPLAIRGAHIAVAAPGVDVLGPAPEGRYQVSSGTSVAAAHVSGIAALLIERKRDLTPAAVRKILLATASDLGPKGHDEQFGAGLADAYRAVQSLQAQVTRPAPTSLSAAR